MTKLKKLGEIVVRDGPCYNKTKIRLLEWLKAYKKRNQSGDINVIKFIEHFAEVVEESETVTTEKC